MSLQSQRVLVTGGAGFIGSHLADRLVKEGAEVTVFDDLSFGHLENVPKGARFQRGDLLNVAQVEEACRGQRFIFHLAAEATTKESAMGWADPVKDMRVNSLGTLNVLAAAAKERPLPRVVFTSSAAVYGTILTTPTDENHPTDPVSPYGVSKLASEKYCVAYHKELGLPCSVARIFNCYGPRQPRYVMYDLILKAKKDPGRLPIIGDGSQARDFTYVSDVVDALILLSQSGPGHIVNVGTGVSTTVLHIANAIKQAIAPNAEIVMEHPTWQGDIPSLLAATGRVNALGFAPKVELRTGLARLIESLA